MNLKKKLALWSASGMLGIGLVVGGGTFAIFTDSTSNTNKEFAAGTINLDQERDSGDSVPGPMFYTSTSDTTGLFPYDKSTNATLGGEAIGGWAPGDTVTRAMNLYNRGSLTAKITRLKADVNPVGVTTGAAYEQFIDKMNIKVTYNTGTGTVLYNGSLRGLLSGWVNIPNILAAANSGAMNVSFEAHLDTSADNTIMGENFVFDFTFYAEQYANN